MGRLSATHSIFVPGPGGAKEVFPDVNSLGSYLSTLRRLPSTNLLDLCRSLFKHSLYLCYHGLVA